MIRRRKLRTDADGEQVDAFEQPHVVPFVGVHEFTDAVGRVTHRMETWGGEMWVYCGDTSLADFDVAAASNREVVGDLRWTNHDQIGGRWTARGQIARTGFLRPGDDLILWPTAAEYAAALGDRAAVERLQREHDDWMQRLARDGAAERRRSSAD